MTSLGTAGAQAWRYLAAHGVAGVGGGDGQVLATITTSDLRGVRTTRLAMQSSETLTPTPVAAPTPAAPPLPAELPPSWADWCDSTTATLRGADVLRSLRPLNPRAGDSAAVLVDVGTHERWMANTPSVGDEVAADDVCAPPIELALFSSNDYLGLSTHPEVRAAAAAAAAAHGCGPRSSSLVAGFTCLHQELESELARLK